MTTSIRCATGTRRLFSKLCVITGAASGIGQGIAVLFAEHGACLVLLDIQPCTETISLLPTAFSPSEKLLYVKTDISSENDIINAMKKIRLKFPKCAVNILVNNAARFIFQSVLTATDNEWQNTLNVNIKGHALMMKHCIPLMPKHKNGSIINIGSISSFIAQPKCVTYAVCKAAMVQLTKNTALDIWADYGIRVNALCPGTIRTPASDLEMVDHNWTFQQWQDVKSRNQIIKRCGTVREVAYACLFFASDESSFCTGTSLLVDGGECAL